MATTETASRAPTDVADVQAPPRRRRPRSIAAGIALIAVCGLTGAWLTSTLSDTVSVVSVTGPVQRGQFIDAGDLGLTDISGGAELDTVPGADLENYVGSRAAVDLAAGTVLTPGSVSDAVVPTGDSALVALAVPRTRLPNETLLAGDILTVVLTPEDGTVGEEPPTTSGTVVSIGAPDASDTVVIDLLVDDAEAPGLTAQVATGRLGIVLTARDRGEDS